MVDDSDNEDKEVKQQQLYPKYLKESPLKRKGRYELMKLMLLLDNLTLMMTILFIHIYFDWLFHFFLFSFVTLFRFCYFGLFLTFNIAFGMNH